MVGDESRQTALEPKKAREVIGRGDATVIDINTDDEWGRTGNIAGALRVSENEVESRLDEIDDDQQVIVVDNEGERSAAVAERLRERGVNAVVLEGGLLAWEDEGLPLQPSADPALPAEPGSVADELATSDRTEDSDQSSAADEATTSDEQPSSDETPGPRETV